VHGGSKIYVAEFLFVMTGDRAASLIKLDSFNDRIPTTACYLRRACHPSSRVGKARGFFSQCIWRTKAEKSFQNNHLFASGPLQAAQLFDPGRSPTIKRWAPL
jgi:hypothetical protein